MKLFLKLLKLLRAGYLGVCLSACALQGESMYFRTTGTPTPPLDRSDSLAGPDANHNGIRDDIDAYIAQQNYTPPQRAAVQQLARAMQAAVTLSGSGPVTMSNAFPVGIKISNAIDCLHIRFDGDHSAPSPRTILHNVEKYTANTSLRAKSYFQFNDAMNGSVSESSQGNTCENP